MSSISLCSYQIPLALYASLYSWWTSSKICMNRPSYFLRIVFFVDR